MHDKIAETGPLRLFLHDEHDTSLDFVQHLLRTVFSKSEREGIALAAQIWDEGGITCRSPTLRRWREGPAGLRERADPQR